MLDRLSAALAALPGVQAVVLGGSRAAGTHRPDSDWDVGVYYRGAFDPAGVRALGHPGYVSAPGEWGPLMNGGAWLTVDGQAVDVLYRDLDRTERWLADAERGAFEILAQNGYLAGAPTYLAVGELAVCRVLHGDLPRPGFPPALAESAPPRWQDRARLALLFAQQHERLGDRVATAGMLANATLCAAHAVLARRREFALNEKGLAERAGLASELAGVAAVGEALGLEPLTER